MLITYESNDHVRIKTWLKNAVTAAIPPNNRRKAQMMSPMISQQK
jgi:hypothetical protein